MVSLDDLKALLGEVLQLGDRAAAFDRSTTLLGSIPEFDSMAVVSLLTAVEERYGIVIDDDDIDADAFATVGSLHDFIAQRVAA